MLTFASHLRGARRGVNRAHLESGDSVFAEHLERRLLLALPELDFSFGAGGISSLPFSGDTRAVRQLPDGKIIAVGSDNAGNVLVARYDADGTLDTTFDGDGVLRRSASGFA